MQNGSSRSGGIRERKDDAAEMVNATVKFRKMMWTLIKVFRGLALCRYGSKISSSCEIKL